MLHLQWALEFGLLRFGVLETGVKNGIGSAIVAAGCCEKPYAAAMFQSRRDQRTSGLPCALACAASLRRERERREEQLFETSNNFWC